jgi:hypothetical protein
VHISNRPCEKSDGCSSHPLFGLAIAAYDRSEREKSLPIGVRATFFGQLASFCTIRKQTVLPPPHQLFRPFGFRILTFGLSVAKSSGANAICMPQPT